jgi:hypothetical protein
LSQIQWFCISLINIGVPLSAFAIINVRVFGEAKYLRFWRIMKAFQFPQSTFSTQSLMEEMK